ncbi:MAG: mechanosensitive ion channel [Desulfobacterales bacterium]|jgi:MscS family membrane protein
MKIILAFILLLFFWGTPLDAINESTPLKPPDTRSPQSTMRVFMDSMQRAYRKSLRLGFKNEKVYVDLNRATQCFDLSEIAPNVVQDVGDETALLLKEVFDRIELPPFEQIPDVSAVESQGLTQWTVPNTAIKIVMMEKGPRQGEFLFSPGTVANVHEYYERVDHLPYKSGASVDAYTDYIYGPGPMIPQHLIRKLPEWTKFGIYDQAIWQWLGLVFTFLIAGTLIVLVFRWTRYKPADSEKSDAEPTVSRWSWRRLAFPIVWMLLVLITDHFLDEQINITGGVLKVVKISLRVLLFIASGWAIIVIGNGIAEFIITSKHAFARSIDANLVRLITRLVTLVLLFVLLWNTSDYLGMSFTAVFASAGIVGLGVALAARETLANFFGGISIFMDRPFKTGDYIVLDTGERGRVSEVGLRSTRILTRDDIQISVPNSLMTSTKVINESAPQPRFRVRVKVGVAYGSDVDQVEETLLSVAGQNNLVTLVPEPRVRFRQFGDSALEFELLCWARRPEDQGRLIHELNYQIYNEFAAASIEIPFPQRDVHLKPQPQDSDQAAPSSVTKNND